MAAWAWPCSACCCSASSGALSGVTGPRFGSFLYGPSTVLAYVRGVVRPEHKVGHNPLGMLSVLALLSLLLLQVSTGLFSDDEIAFTGPLVSLVSGDTVSLATKYHKSIGKLLVLLLVVVHVAAIVFYKLVKKDNLIRPMVLGDKQVDVPVPSAADSAKSRLLALVLWAMCAAAVLRSGGPGPILWRMTGQVWLRGAVVYSLAEPLFCAPMSEPRAAATRFTD